ncbi:MAG: N-acetylmuramoyl-L-alanine amidase [Desulfovibrio sp.]|jgi:N-acetylmuramoyl-L-alanine amidase|nr:N-acetylmuramoyl-L-alanine amidase [Desulfovibrio sp.]
MPFSSLLRLLVCCLLPAALCITEADRCRAVAAQSAPAAKKKDAPAAKKPGTARAAKKSSAPAPKKEAVSAGKSGVKDNGKPDELLAQLGLQVKVIMLDPGHGGKDPGAEAAGIVEKQFTLNAAKRLGALLRKRGFTVLYTRTGNGYLTLQQRPNAANAKKADLFISLHVNANPKPSVRGFETYYLSEAKTGDAATVAARENGVPVSKLSDLQFILTDLMLDAKVRESRRLAETVHRGILNSLRRNGLPCFDNGVRAAPFYVLVGARMPAVLVEFGYITNKDDAVNLKSEAYLARQCEGIVDGVQSFARAAAGTAPR